MNQTATSKQEQPSSISPASQQYISVKLSGDQYRRLVEALLNAFTSYEDFSVMLRFELDTNLDAIVS